jgi:hypothetical protein
LEKVTHLKLGWKIELSLNAIHEFERVGLLPKTSANLKDHIAPYLQSTLLKYLIYSNIKLAKSNYILITQRV